MLELLIAKGGKKINLFNYSIRYSRYKKKRLKKTNKEFTGIKGKFCTLGSGV